MPNTIHYDIRVSLAAFKKAWDAIGQGRLLTTHGVTQAVFVPQLMHITEVAQNDGVALTHYGPQSFAVHDPRGCVEDAAVTLRKMPDNARLAQFYRIASIFQKCAQDMTRILHIAQATSRAHVDNETFPLDQRIFVKSLEETDHGWKVLAFDDLQGTPHTPPPRALLDMIFMQKAAAFVGDYAQGCFVTIDGKRHAMLLMAENGQSASLFEVDKVGERSFLTADMVCYYPKIEIVDGAKAGRIMQQARKLFGAQPA